MGKRKEQPGREDVQDELRLMRRRLAEARYAGDLRKYAGALLMYAALLGRYADIVLPERPPQHSKSPKEKRR